MSQSHKTKEEILQELESIKDLLLEDEDIPVLQELEHQLEQELIHHQQAHDQQASRPPSLMRDPSVLPGQGSLFGDVDATRTPVENTRADEGGENLPSEQQHPTQNDTLAVAAPQTSPSHKSQPQAKAQGANPFLPEHIRARLHGNNPLPSYDVAPPPVHSRGSKASNTKDNPSRQRLINEVLASMMPKIEQELKFRLYSMSVADLEKLLEDDD